MKKIFQSFNLPIFKLNDDRSGQSLIEVIVGLAIGAILMGASAFAIAGMIQTNNTSQKWRSATALAQGLLTNARAYGTVNWQNLYGLSKGSSSDYFLNASGTTYNVIGGKEGMLDNDVTSGLVGEWKFDEDIGTTSTLTYDATGNGDNGTLMSSPTRATSTCKIANCLVFNGSNYVSIPNSATLELRNAISISAWVNPATSTASTQLAIMGKSSEVILSLSYGQSRFTIYATAGGYSQAMGGTILPANTWYHIVGTFDGNQIKIYENGVLKGTTNYSTSIADTAAIPYIGSAGGYQFFSGSIDDVRIYNRALSAYEVGQLYNSNVFKRYFYVENTCRTNDASSSISGVSPCAGGSADDPSTQKISAITEWTTPTGANPQVLLSDYVTRWKNSVFQQNDWSGGPNATGVTTNPTNLFTSSSNVNFSGKSLRIQGL